MTAVAAIARLREGGRTWALGALTGNDAALASLANALLQHWHGRDRLVILGNMLGAAGNPARTLDLLLSLRRRLLARPGAHACDFVFLRGAQEEMWHKALRLQFALTPLDVLDWMLARGLDVTIEAYGHSVAEGRAASRNGPSAIARWTTDLRQRQAQHPGHTDILNTLMRAALSADGRLAFSAAGIEPARPIAEQADAFWWNAQTDASLDAALEQATDDGWARIVRLVRGAGPGRNTAGEVSRVLTVTRDTPALVALDDAGEVLERIEP